MSSVKSIFQPNEDTAGVEEEEVQFNAEVKTEAEGKRLQLQKCLLCQKLTRSRVDWSRLVDGKWKASSQPFCTSMHGALYSLQNNKSLL